MKICFCTSIFSRDGNLPDTPGHFEKLKEYDYYCFTNIDKSKFDTSWDIIKINLDKEIGNFKRIITVSRYPKFMAWEYFKKKHIEYDVIYYCDGFCSPRNDINWNLLSEFINVCDNIPLYVLSSSCNIPIIISGSFTSKSSVFKSEES